jgi:hypothetical protein
LGGDPGEMSVMPPRRPWAVVSKLIGDLPSVIKVALMPRASNIRTYHTKRRNNLSKIPKKKFLTRCFDYLAIYLVSNAKNPCMQHFFGCAFGMLWEIFGPASDLVCA